MARRPFQPTDTSGLETGEATYRMVIEEQRRDYDYLLRIYERAGSKENVLLTATFGIIAYLYYNAPAGSKHTIAERLFVPQQDYGKVIYIIAASFFILGLFRLIFNVFGDNPWETAYETKKPTYDDKSLRTLKYVKKRYDKVKTTNLTHI
jgi:hypothetical protein